MRRLLYGEHALADLPQHTGADPDAVAAAVDRLETAGIVKRSTGDVVFPRADAETYFLTLLSMTYLYQGHDSAPDGRDEASRAIVVRIAADLSENTHHPPPFEKFASLGKSDRAIALFQAIPISLPPARLADLKAGGRLPFSDLNEAQQEYLQAMLAEIGQQEYDFGKTTIRIDLTHTRDDDHGNLVVEDGRHSHQIDAYLEDTPRPCWY